MKKKILESNNLKICMISLSSVPVFRYYDPPWLIYLHSVFVLISWLFIDEFRGLWGRGIPNLFYALKILVSLLLVKFLNYPEVSPREIFCFEWNHLPIQLFAIWRREGPCYKEFHIPHIYGIIIYYHFAPNNFRTEFVTWTWSIPIGVYSTRWSPCL